MALPRDFLSDMTHCIERVKQAEDVSLQARARALIPLERLRNEAKVQAELNSEDSTMKEEDYLAQGLCQWFKHDAFFSWVDKAACSFCGNANTTAVGVQAPNQEERRHMASRTEVYQCSLCGTVSRFPRYNSVAKLLETRKGRCGEWANCFLLVCRASGLTARYVWDATDHVWTEYWSHALGRWVHMDSCEAAHDKPLLYEAGWGKALSYVIGVGSTGLVDVTHRYTRKYPEVLTRRTRCPESSLRRLLVALTLQLRRSLPPSASPLHVVLARDLSELWELYCFGSAGGPAPAEVAGLGGRTTGSEEWRRQRGETGEALQACAIAPPPASTPWSPVSLFGSSGTKTSAAEQSPVAQHVVQALGRLSEGACRASGDNGRAEGAAQAFDASVVTKWLDFGGGGEQGSAWLEFKLLGKAAASGSVVVSHYDLVSANDSPERDPHTWVLEGWVPAAAPGAGKPAGPSSAPGSAAAAGAANAGGSTSTNDTDTRSKDSSTSQPASQAEQRPGLPLQGGGSWVQLDSQAGVLFGERHELRAFQVTTHLPCTSWRLKITRTLHPPSANSVQLACLNLYAAPNAQIPAETQSAGALQQSSGDWGATAAAVRSQLGSSEYEVLRKLHANIADLPGEQKFRRVRLSRLPEGLHASQAALDLLMKVGWRPLLVILPGDNSPDWTWVLEAGPEAIARASAAAEALSKSS